MELVWAGLLEALRLIAARDPALLEIALLSLRVSLAATLLAALGAIARRRRRLRSAPA